MDKRLKAKYKIGQVVEFTFAGANFTGEIFDIQKTSTRIKYWIRDDQHTKYPVIQEHIINNK